MVYASKLFSTVAGMPSTALIERFETDRESLIAELNAQIRERVALSSREPSM
ncbi:MAG: hypothetical protein MI753_11365 [Hyphomicrobiales bacterium]|nr:hypothetical protein [Hyphomicrobiales bacterium]